MTATATPAKLESGTTWSQDGVHSTLDFRVRHLGLTWLRGGFNEFAAALTVDADGGYVLTGETPVASVTFPNEQLIGHLQSPDFFDAQLHPKLTFTSTSVELADDGTATVVGDLTMRGTTKSVELAGRWSGPIAGMQGESRIGLELQGEVDRNDFGISWAAELPGNVDVLARTVRLSTELELVKQ